MIRQDDLDHGLQYGDHTRYGRHIESPRKSDLRGPPLPGNRILLTTDGRALTGMIAAETATSVTLKRADNATDTVLRIDIEELQSTGVSLMPEGMEKQIDKQAMADLLAYLLSVR